MAGRFTANGRTYTDTPAGHLQAARDRVADKALLRGHDMMHWRKEAQAIPPMNQPGYPSLLRFGQVRWCPGRQGRR